jgi:hypothetical protein
MAPTEQTVPLVLPALKVFRVLPALKVFRVLPALKVRLHFGFFLVNGLAALFTTLVRLSLTLGRLGTVFVMHHWVMGRLAAT